MKYNTNHEKVTQQNGVESKCIATEGVKQLAINQANISRHLKT